MRHVLSRFRKTMYLRNALLYLVLYPVYTWLLSFYTPHLFLQLLLAIPACLFPAHSLQRYLEVRQARINRLLFGQFLQMMTSELAGGKTWIPSMNAVTWDLVHLNGDTLPFLKLLLNCNQQIQNQIPVVDALQHWAEQIPCTEAKPILLALASQLQQQGSVQDLIKFSNSMIQELNDLENWLASENGKQLAEAFLLNLMPLFLAGILQYTAKSYMLQAFTSWIGQGFLLLAFSLSVVGTTLSLQFAAAAFRQATYPPIPPLRLWRKTIEESTTLQRWGWGMLRLFPKPRLFALQASLQQLGTRSPANIGEKAETHLLRYASYFLPILVFSSCFSLLLVLQHALPLVGFPIPIAFFLFIYSQEPLRRAQACRQSILLSFPLFSGLLSAFLRSGFVPRKALDLCIHPLSDPDTVWGRELKQLSQKLQLQQGWEPAILRLAHEVQIPEIQSALTLLVQYAKNGSSDTLTLFVLQSEMCWRICRNALRKKREQESLRILFPMFLHLLSVIALTVAPVLAQFQTGGSG